MFDGTLPLNKRWQQKVSGVLMQHLEVNMWCMFGLIASLFHCNQAPGPSWAPVWPPRSWEYLKDSDFHLSPVPLGLQLSRSATEPMLTLSVTFGVGGRPERPSIGYWAHLLCQLTSSMVFSFRQPLFWLQIAPLHCRHLWLNQIRNDGSSHPDTFLLVWNGLFSFPRFCCQFSSLVFLGGGGGVPLPAFH